MDNPATTPRRVLLVREHQSGMGLARYYAKQAVKEEWKRQGLRPHHIVANHLNQAAENYFDQHREKLIARACAALRIFEQKRKR
jgi:hypothetical protein